MSKAKKSISLRLSRADALVLFDLLSGFKFEDRIIKPDVAAWHALNAVCSELECVLHEQFADDYRQIISRAKQELLEKWGDISH